MNKALIAAVALTATSFATSASAFDILVYDNNTDKQNAQAALSNLGLLYALADVSSFDTQLTSHSWDLVVMDIPSAAPDFANFISYVANGGKAILSYWDLDTEAALAAAFEVTVASSNFAPEDVYAWDAGHPIWDGVGGVLDAWTDNWDDNGDKFSLVGASMVGGFTPGVMANQGAIGVGNGGKTIANGFLFDDIDDAKGIKLIENEIMFLLEGRSSPVPDAGSTLALFGLGMAALVFVRRKSL